jgi:D-tyrosyl-tRNA(Tyr) deacylase
VRVVVQRVAWARVSVEGELKGSCGQGLLLLAAAHLDDDKARAEKMAVKIAGLRIFNDAEGKMNLALSDLPEQDPPQVLAVSQFTLYGDASKSRRPSFTESAPFDQGQMLFDHFVDSLRPLVRGVETGVFGASMQVELLNDGPVTLIVDL